MHELAAFPDCSHAEDFRTGAAGVVHVVPIERTTLLLCATSRSKSSLEDSQGNTVECDVIAVLLPGVEGESEGHRQ